MSDQPQKTTARSRAHPAPALTLLLTGHLCLRMPSRLRKDPAHGA